METLRNCTKNGKCDRYPVFDSIKKQHLDCLAMIISKYPKMIYLRDHSGFPPLCQAAYTDFKDGCELILRYSEAAKNPFSDEPLLTYSNYRQETPLFLAVEAQHLEVVMFLMQAGASAVHPCIRG
ncbi:unnamed protein product [Oikopleura dioica]|uniref:Uncharacterized protein n=1 Tax=Oikopleura dioica TaxID=34765 RepID=E4X6G4_OIKDI|nr:unnamed protein product [Oikopleura dioica]